MMPLLMMGGAAMQRPASEERADGGRPDSQMAQEPRKQRNIWPWITAGVAAVAILLLGIIIGNRTNGGGTQQAIETSTVSTTASAPAQESTESTATVPTTTQPSAVNTTAATPSTTTARAAAPATAANSWPLTTGRIGVAPSPAFPTALPGWQLHNTWAVMPRAFTGGQQTRGSGPNYIPFPSTMNGCDNQRFLVRWRAVNPTAQVEASKVDAVDSVVQKVTANAGWMDFDGCRTPAFRLPRNAADGSTLTDVAVSVEQLYPAP